MSTDAARNVQTHEATYDRILVPLDGSDEAEAALRVAAQLPSREILLLHVELDDDLLVPEWITDPKASPEETTVRAELERLAASLRDDGHNVTVISRTGDVAAQIISTAMDADLVVMTTHGRGAAGRLIFGSVADRVVRHGMTPTLLLRRGAHTEAPRSPQRVLVTLDGSQEAELSLPAARKLARVLSVPVVLLRAVGFDEVRATLRKEREAGGPATIDSADRYEQARLATIDEANRYLTTHVEQLRSDGLEAESQVVEGTPAFSLMWAMTPEDVVVTTTYGRGGYKRWQIGSVAEKLVRQAPCPVLLQRVPSGNEVAS